MRKSKILVVIVGQRHGTMVPGSDISYSETEYREAYRLSIGCLVYLQGAVDTPHQHAERDSSKAILLERWKQTLRERHTCAEFKEANSLALQVAIDVARTIKEIDEEDRARSREPSATNVPTSRSEVDTEPPNRGDFLSNVWRCSAPTAIFSRRGVTVTNTRWGTTT